MEPMHCVPVLVACGLLLVACGDDADTNDTTHAPDSGASDAGHADMDAPAEDATDAPTEDGPPSAQGAHQLEVEGLADPLMDAAWTNAMVVGLVSSEGVEYYAFGTTSAGAAPDELSVFEIGSVSKTITTLVLADLVEDGVVSLDQPVQQLLPVEVQVPEFSGEVITLRHLSTHHSGLPRMPDNFDPANVSDPYADYGVQDMYDFLSGYALPRAPGASFEYSNLGAGLLGHALSRETGLDYETLVRERVIDPLNLRDTGIELDSEQQTRFLQGHDADGEPTPPWRFDVLAPAGAMRSTATDMIAYVSAQAGLSSSSLDPAIVASHEQQYAIGSGREIGLAWMIDEGRYIWHNGGTGGFGSFVGFDTQTKTGVAVLSSTQGIYAPESGLGFALLRMMAGESYEPVDLPPTVQMSATELGVYAGEFDATVQGQSFQMTFTVEGQNLYAHLPGVDPLKLYAMAEAKFYMRLAPIWVTFEGSGGVYDAFTFLQQGGSTITGTRAE